MKTRQELVEVIAGELYVWFSSDGEWQRFRDVADLDVSRKYVERATTILTAIEAAGARVVPVVATDEMVSAGTYAEDYFAAEIAPRNSARAIDAYTAMLNSSPFKGE